MRAARFLLPLLAVCGSMAAGQDTPAAAHGESDGPVMTFTFDWPAQTPSHYEITVRADGMGYYRGAPAVGVLAQGAGDEGKPLLLSARAVARLQAAASVLSAGRACETSQKKLAQTGTKTLRVEQSGTVLRCTYNYSDDKHIQDATATFQGIAMTMEEAPRLEHLHRFDRLGLDAELAVFTQSVRDGRALEVGNIAPTLRSLAADNDLMERVRVRANDLLQRAGGSPSS